MPVLARPLVSPVLDRESKRLRFAAISGVAFAATDDQPRLFAYRLGEKE
jgi:hypothetical protein